MFNNKFDRLLLLIFIFSSCFVSGYTYVVQKSSTDNNNTATRKDDLSNGKQISLSVSEEDIVTRAKLKRSEESGLVQMKFTVMLNEKLDELEKVGVTGDIPVLGCWKVNLSIPMQPEIGANARLNHWFVNVELSKDIHVSYRYFIYKEEDDGRKQILRWENHLDDRKRMSAGNSVFVDQFGLINDEMQINRGWLTHQNIVQFKFDRPNQLEISERLAANYNETTFFVKVVPMRADSDSLESSAKVEYVKMGYGNSRLKSQESDGVLYEFKDIVIFHITVPAMQSTSYEISLYTRESKLIGRVKVMPNDVKSSDGILDLAVKSADDGSEMARIRLPFVVIRPAPFAKEYDFRTSFSHSWKCHWSHLDCGHRGMGRSFINNPSPIIENTIASFMEIHKLHGDGVELDVQLTADLVPIIYHDFEFLTAAKDAVPKSESDLVKVFIKDYSYEEIKDMRIFITINGKINEFPSYNAEPCPEKRIFPTLIDVFTALPKTLAIDIELKYPQTLASGEEESEQSIDKNQFVDEIINATQHHGCGRPMIFTSFDADVCTMLRFKQNMIAVGFLTLGKTKKWEEFMDRRTKNTEAAINQAQAFELAAIAPHAEELVERPELVKAATDFGKKVFVWGDALNSDESLKFFKDIGTTVLIYDRMDEIGPKNKKRNIYETDESIELFKAQCLRRGTVTA